MLRIQKSEGRTVAAHVTMLSLSWLNNRFSAAAIHRGVLEQVWEPAEPVEGTNRFEELLREAVQQTRYRGQTVSLVMAHPRLSQQLVDLPPVQGPSLTRLVERQAMNQKMFTGEAAWAFQALPAAKDTQRVILHLFPKILLNQLSHACRKNELNLMAVVPASALLQHQVLHNSADKDQTILMAGNTHGSTAMFVGNFQGQTFLARTLPGDWAEGDRLALDLNRTVLYVGQQFGVTVGKVYLFGLGAEERAKALQTVVQPTPAVSPVTYDPHYWATEAAALRPGMFPNFISPEMQKAPQRRIFAKVVAGLTVALLISALAFSGFAHWQARQETATIQKLSTQLDRLKMRRGELVQRNTELDRKKEVAAVVVDGRQAPMAAWFLAYLGQATPSDLVITNMRVWREGVGWRFKLGGVFQPPSGNAPSADPAQVLDAFKQRLSGPPFNISLYESDKPTATAQPSVAAPPLLSGLASNSPDWLSKLVKKQFISQPLVKRASLGPTDHFALQGVMR